MGRSGGCLPQLDCCPLSWTVALGQPRPPSIFAPRHQSCGPTFAALPASPTQSCKHTALHLPLPCAPQAIDAYQVEDYRLSASMNVLNVAQSVVIYAGMAAGLLVCTKASVLALRVGPWGGCLPRAACGGIGPVQLMAQVGCLPTPAAIASAALPCCVVQGIANGSLTVGDAVLFVTLMQQLYGPLNFFGTCEGPQLPAPGLLPLLLRAAPVLWPACLSARMSAFPPGAPPSACLYLSGPAISSSPHPFLPPSFPPADYRMIQQAMLDMENMFQLLGQHPALQARAAASMHCAAGAAGRGSRLLCPGRRAPPGHLASCDLQDPCQHPCTHAHLIRLPACPPANVWECRTSRGRRRWWRVTTASTSTTSASR